MNQFITGDGNQKTMLLIETREKTSAFWKQSGRKWARQQLDPSVSGRLQVP